MKIDKKNIQVLLSKYYEGKTSLEEEEALRAYLQSSEGKESDEIAAEIFDVFDAFGKETPNAEIEIADFTPLASDTEVRTIDSAPNLNTFNFSWVSGLAAGLVLLIVGFGLGMLLGQRDSTNSDQFASLKNDMEEMKQLVALSNLQKDSPSERIKATYEVRSLREPDEKVLNALINTLKNDPNLNVKIAAAEALYTFGDNDKVRLAYVESLNEQQDPLMKIKLIDMLVQLGEKRALPQLREVMNDQYQMKVVRERAAQGIGKLL